MTHESEISHGAHCEPVGSALSVKPGCDADFERALHDFVQRFLALPGQMGVSAWHLISPSASGRTWYGSEQREQLARTRSINSPLCGPFRISN
jgi:hypothetical protein